MKVLVACEYSAVVRRAFQAMGHDAMSCDLLPTEVAGPHYQGDVRDVLYSGEWDMMIAHPPCTYLANSGVQHLHTDPTRWAKMEAGAQFFLEMLNAPIPRIAVENPIMHKYAKAIIRHGYAQIVHPWMFGHTEQKATCLWLKGLPNLQPTKIMEERNQTLWRLPPSPDRWKLRSQTFEGIALAMAAQWGGVTAPVQLSMFDHAIA